MKKSFLLITIICGLTLTGCAQLTKLDDKQSDEVAEYMAGTVLRYAKNYDEALIYPEHLIDANGNIISDDSKTGTKNTASENTTSKEPTKALDADKQSNSVDVKELFNTIGDNKYSINYTGHESYTSYPNDNDYFTLEPTKGNKLLTFSFTIKNLNNKALNIDLVNKKISYTLENVSGRNYKPAVTLLTNDIQYLKNTIEANASLKAVLVFEIPENTKEKDLSLNINYSGKSSVINIEK